MQIHIYVDIGFMSPETGYLRKHRTIPFGQLKSIPMLLPVSPVLK